MGKGKQIFLAIEYNWEPLEMQGSRWFDDIWFLLESVGFKAFNGLSYAWEAFSKQYNLYPIPESIKSPIEKQFFLQARRMGIDLEPQHEVNVAGKTYRIDFVYPGKPIAIELDGHDYHKTKEQRTADAQRERALQSMGWTVIRFTGTEIYHDTQKCVLETIRLSAGI